MSLFFFFWKEIIVSLNAKITIVLPDANWQRTRKRVNPQLVERYRNSKLSNFMGHTITTSTNKRKIIQVKVREFRNNITDHSPIYTGWNITFFQSLHNHHRITLQRNDRRPSLLANSTHFLAAIASAKAKFEI